MLAPLAPWLAQRVFFRCACVCAEAESRGFSLFLSIHCGRVRTRKEEGGRPVYSRRCRGSQASEERHARKYQPGLPLAKGAERGNMGPLIESLRRGARINGSLNKGEEEEEGGVRACPQHRRRRPLQLFILGFRSAHFIVQQGGGRGGEDE